MRVLAWTLLCLSLVTSSVSGQVVLGPEIKLEPGADQPTPWLLYRDPAATNVVVAGSWDRWVGRNALQPRQDMWAIDIRTLGVPFGRHEYKFIVNGVWEEGNNRYFHVNRSGLMEKPPDLIQQALIQDFNNIEVFLKRGVVDPEGLDVRLEPPVALEEWHLTSAAESGYPQGYALGAGTVTFYFDEHTYGMDIKPTERVNVAGNFNGWNGDNPRWQLQDRNNNDIWELTIQRQAIRLPAGEKDAIFKFVVRGNEWKVPPASAPNALDDGKGNVNLRIDPKTSGSTTIEITTAQPLKLTQSYVVAIDGLVEKTVRKMASPGNVFTNFYSDKELGVIIDREQEATTYRIFAPRATSVKLCLYDQPEYAQREPELMPYEPVEEYALWMDPEDRVWEISLLGIDFGQYYAFKVDGPDGDGEAFDPRIPIGDPYALAAAHAENNTIVIDREATNQWFKGWTDDDYEPPAKQDMVIYEAHLRDLTIHPSSGVDPRYRGKYHGIIDSEGTGTGLDHIKDMGFNMIEFLPLNEFNNGVSNSYNWGYTTVYYFAPEASYAMFPLQGSQYYEFKQMVNDLHERGFGVIMDVVYNHVGYPNIFSQIDKKYYFRLNPDWTYSNFSGVGNDVKSESLMMRRFIVDNIMYWIEEHHVDGFRFDLAELIDMETMLAIRDAVFEKYPEVILISEPWSFRGENKAQLKGTGWSAWNNDFRYAAKGFAMGDRNRDWLKQGIFGSVNSWAANPLQPINYVESHDDMALADEFSTRPDRDGRYLIPNDVEANKLAATILFTSLGIPMVNEGQEFLRSKRGIHNTYNKGDEVNAIRWTDRDRPLAKETMTYYRDLIHLRNSDAGAAFRVRQKPPQEYYRWIEPGNEQALGYIVNAGRMHAGSAFIVLVNAAGEPVEFNVPFPVGTWRLIGDGDRVNREGLANMEPVAGPRLRTVTIPPLKTAIFMDGF